MSVTARIALAIAFVSVLCPATAQAQAADDHQLIQDLLARIQALEAEVKSLKDAQARPAAPQPAPAATPAEEMAGVPGTGGPTLQIHGFADVDYVRTGEPLTAGSFSLGQLDLFMSSTLSENTSVVGELVTEANDENAFGVDLERLLLQFKPSDYLNIGVGRYHTAIGYYNTAYHHGTWFQTATGRPFLFAFEDEGGPLPVHGVGVTVNGRIPSGKLGLRYVAEVANGRTSRSRLAEPVQNVIDENNRKAFNIALLAQPDTLTGFQAGLSMYRDRLEPAQLPRIRQTILSGHVVYHGHGLELLNEAVAIHHVPAGGSAVTTPAFYSQISQQFARKASPYFRYQYFNAPDRELIFGDIGLMKGPSLGVRYDFESFAALKVQFDRTVRRHADPVNGFATQLAFTF
ncbi:MAG TPA: hypothetical protein VGJ52_06520 [Vicinamibacterales bacterium]